MQTTVVDPLWVKPLPREVIELAADHVLVATPLSWGSRGRAHPDPARAGIQVPVRTFGVTAGFPHQGTRAEILAEAGLTAQAIAQAVIAAAAPEPSEPSSSRPLPLGAGTRP